MKPNMGQESQQKNIVKTTNIIQNILYPPVLNKERKTRCVDLIKSKTTSNDGGSGEKQKSSHKRSSSFIRVKESQSKSPEVRTNLLDNEEDLFSLKRALIKEENRKLARKSLIESK